MLSADPFHPVVRGKSKELTDAFLGSHRVDLLFEDQVGARPNYLNLRVRGPHPTATTAPQATNTALILFIGLSPG